MSPYGLGAEIPQYRSGQFRLGKRSRRHRCTCLRSQSLNTDQGSSDLLRSLRPSLPERKVSIPQYRSGQFRQYLMVYCFWERGCSPSGLNPSIQIRAVPTKKLGLWSDITEKESQSLNTDQGSSDRKTPLRPRAGCEKSQSLNTDQ